MKNRIEITATEAGAFFHAELDRKLLAKAFKAEQEIQFCAFERKDGKLKSVESVQLQEPMTTRPEYLNGSDLWLFRRARITAKGTRFVTGTLRPFKPEGLSRKAEGVVIEGILEKTSDRAMECHEFDVFEHKAENLL